MVGMRRLLPVILLLSALPGCRGPAAGEVAVAPEVNFRLCLPETGPAFFALQELAFSFPGGRRELVVAAIENKGGAMNLVVSSPLGQTLFTVQVRGRAALVDARVPLPPGLDPQLLPALVQLALWPAEALRAGLEPGTTLEQDGPRRSLLHKGRVVWTVARDGAGLVLENPAQGLTVRVRTLEE
jgi:hypothetical protein